ncbi:MAG TPA: hypothetical protein VM681_02095 [Candidatus Thermoplasmatota archaeon]|nr:hypothetical protein [Candidatus Thermoplasmatota archaeon]
MSNRPRAGFLLAAPLLFLVLAGCAGPTAPGPGLPGSSLPPALLVDRSHAGTLQLYVHAKHAVVRYDWINVSLENETVRAHRQAYALDAVLETSAGHVEVTVDDGTLSWSFAAYLRLNETASPRLLETRLFNGTAYGEWRNLTLPHERLLQRGDEP